MLIHQCVQFPLKTDWSGPQFSEYVIVTIPKSAELSKLPDCQHIRAVSIDGRQWSQELQSLFDVSITALNNGHAICGIYLISTR